MKKLIAFVAAVVAMGSFAEQLDHWVYDATAKTISDGVWTLSATLTKNTTNLTVNNPVDGGYPNDPANPQELNFAKEIQDAGDPAKTYSLTSLGFSCGTADSWKSNRDRPIIPSAWAGCIGRLVFPPTGSCKFTTLGDTAFSYTTNLVEVVNFLPDEITKLGNCTFRFSSVNQPLYLRGLVSMEGDKKAEYTFCGSKITSVTFGPNLTYLGGGVEYRSVGSFSSSELEEIHFDPAMSGATLAGRYNFAGAPKLKTRPDLRGFSKLSALFVFDGAGFTNDTMVIPADVVTFNAGFMNGSKTKNLVFMGTPPTVSGTLNNGTVLTTYIPEKYKAEWAIYTDGNKVVDEASTTWNSTIAGKNFANFPLIYEAKAGDLGYWVYDADEAYDGGVGTVSDTNGVWKFRATLSSGTQLSVGKWITYPSVPSELDFTQPLTDTKGLPYVFIALNTQFGVDDSRHWISGEGLCYPTEASGSVGSLKYSENMVSFGARAFGCCTNLVSVTPMLGDWVSSVGQAAFAKTPVAGDLRLVGVTSLGFGAFQRCTNLTSVAIGSGLTSFLSRSAQDAGTFQGCVAMTNVSFGIGMSGAKLGENQNGYGNHFYGCTNLTGTLDLSGFTNLGYTREVSLKNAFSGTRYDNIIIGGKVTEMSRDAFLGMASLTNVTFLGAPPVAAAMSKDGFAIYGTLPQKVTTTIEKAFWADWEPYVEGGLNTKHRTWKAEYVDESVDIKNRPVWVNGVKFGLMLLVK